MDRTAASAIHRQKLVSTEDRNILYTLRYLFHSLSSQPLVRLMIISVVFNAKWIYWSFIEHLELRKL